MSAPRTEGWRYVITKGFPEEFRFVNRSHSITTVLTVAVIDGRFVIHRDGKELVDGDRPAA